MNEFRQVLAGPQPVVAPLVCNPLSAKLAEAAGFRALYLGGGEPGRAAADHADRLRELGARAARRHPALIPGVLGEEPLDGANGDCAVPRLLER